MVFFVCFYLFIFFCDVLVFRTFFSSMKGMRGKNVCSFASGCVESFRRLVDLLSNYASFQRLAISVSFLFWSSRYKNNRKKMNGLCCFVNIILCGINNYWSVYHFCYSVKATGRLVWFGLVWWHINHSCYYTPNPLYTHVSNIHNL